MNSLNLIAIEGNLTRDPEMKYTSGGSAVCNLSIASNRSYKKGDGYVKEVSFFDVTCWGKTAEACSENLTKGRGVRVVGRLKQDRWGQEGNARSRVVIVADHVDFMPQREKREVAEY